MAEKAPYKLTIKLDSSRPDAIGDALRQLRDIAGEYDQAGEGTASITIESYQEKPLSAICDDFEEWLYKHAIGLGCEMRIQRPGLRFEMLSTLRARHATPMDETGWAAEQNEDEPLVTEPPPVVAGLLGAAPLALPAPNDELVIEGSFTVDE